MAQFGWKAGAEQYSPRELLDYAIAAEAAGFDALDVSDHFHPWAEKGQAAFAWTWLGAVAARTSTIKLGPGVTCPILRYHPSIVAQACATLACLAPGRVYLGVGTGEALNEYSSVGQWPEYTVRQAQLGEAIGLMKALWQGEPVTHRGEFYETHQAKIYSSPGASIPIYVSSLVPDSAYFAGLHGDGLFTVGGEEPKLYREMIRNFEAGAKKAGRDGARLAKIIEVAADFTADKPQAIAARKAYWAGAMVPAMFTQRLHTPSLSEANGKVVGAETIEKAACISDDPSEHVEHARRYLELGFDQLYFHSAGPDQRRFVEAYGQRVLPQLRAMKPRTSSAKPRKRG
jgi:coenzyme F420-dependent glucose-6-phosphate dehydrogenase